MRSRRRGLAVWVLLLVLVWPILAGCSKEEEEGSELFVRVLYPVGGRGDKSFADSVFAGVTFARWRLQADVVELAPKSSDRASALWEQARSAPPQGQDIILTLGFEYIDAIIAADCDFNGHKILHLDANLPPCDDLISVSYRTFEPSFLAGVASMQTSPRKTAAVIGGAPLPAVNEFIRGYVAGVTHAGGQVTQVRFLSDTTEGFADPELAQQEARALFEEADVIFPVAGGSGLGVIDAALEREGERWVIGVDGDQTFLGSKVVIGSVLKRLDRTVFNVLSELADGRFEPGPRSFDTRFGATEFLLNARFEPVVAEAVNDASETAREAADEDLRNNPL